MSRLKFDLRPVDRNLEGRNWTQEEHDAWVRDTWKRWKRPGKPTPCDCGYYGDGWLATCDERERLKCRIGVEKRLEAYYRNRHKEALAKKRKFPGLPHKVPFGTCSWCGQPIVHGRVKQRGLHDGREDEPRCKQAYHLHTDLGVQQGHLLKRDGLGCVKCGKIVGRWGRWLVLEEQTLDRWSAERPDRWPRDIFSAPATMVSWQTGLEVDHFIALAVAYECFPDDNRRRWFFGPRNLRLLCPGCHKAKTQRDRALLRDIYAHGPEHGKAIVLNLLSQAGLLKGANA